MIAPSSASGIIVPESAGPSRFSPGFSRAFLDSVSAVAPDELPGLEPHGCLARSPLGEPLAPDVSVESISAFHRAIFDKQGAAHLRLLGRNISSRLVPQLTALPEFVGFRTTLGTVPSTASRKTAVEMVQRFIEENLGPTRITWTPLDVLFELLACPICSRISGSPQPVCSGLEGLLSGTLRFLTGRPIYVTEIACASAGSSRCVFQIR